MPNVVGLTQAAAEAAITRVELRVGGVVGVSSATVPVGQVVTQNPAAGTLVFTGTSVGFYVSMGTS